MFINTYLRQNNPVHQTFPPRWNRNLQHATIIQLTVYIKIYQQCTENATVDRKAKKLMTTNPFHFLQKIVLMCHTFCKLNKAQYYHLLWQTKELPVTLELQKYSTYSTKKFNKQNQTTLTSEWWLPGMYTARHTNNNSVVRKLPMDNITFISVISVHHHPTNYQHLVRSLCRTSVIKITHGLTRLCHLTFTQQQALQITNTVTKHPTIFNW